MLATQKINSDPAPSVPSCNDWAFEPILHNHFNKLRARLMNLAEASTRDKQQSDAIKGLMKDFVNEAYYPALRDIEGFLREKGVIPEGINQCGNPAIVLTAKSISDYLYEPE